MMTKISFKKKNIAVIVVVAIIIGLFFYYKNPLVIGPQNDDEIVKISDRGLASALPIYIAIEKGYFKEFNLKPELIKFTAGNDVFNSLSRNELNVGEIPIDPIVFAEDKTNTGVKIFLVGKWSENTNKNFDALFTTKNSKINSLKSLENKKVGVFPGVTAKIFLTYYLNKNRVDSSKIEFVQLTPNLQLQSLSTGAIDALFAYQPIVTIAENNNFTKIEDSIYNKIGINYFAVYAFSDSFSKTNTAKNTEKALLKAIQYMKTDEMESRKILSKYTSLEKLSYQMKYFPEYSIPTNIDKEEVKNLIEFYKNNGLISNSFTNEKINSIFYN